MIGWIAGVCFSLCAVPLVYDAIKAGHTDLNIVTLLLWTVGELGMLIDTWKFRHWPSRFNYIFNLVCLIIIWSYRL